MFGEVAYYLRAQVTIKGQLTASKMMLIVRAGPDSPRQLRRTLPFVASVCVHAVVIGSLLLLPPFPDGAWGEKRVRTAVRLEIAPKEHKVIWLRKNERLPDISPTVQRADAGPKRKDPDKLAVAANPPNARHWDQFIYVPVPKVEEQKVIPSPNLLVTTLASPVPPKPEPRKFVPPPDLPKVVKPREIELQEPAIAKNLGAGLDMKAPAGLSKVDAPKPAGKKFVPPPDPQRKVPSRIIDLPEGLPLQAGSSDAIKLAIPVGQPDAPRPPGRKFVPPAALAGGSGLGGARGGASASEAVAVPDIATAPLQAGVPGAISAVIISANPSANASIIPPEGNRASKIRSGSMPGGNGGSPGSAGGDGFIVPGVTVRGGNGVNSGSELAANKLPPAPLAASAVTPTPLPTIRPRLTTATVSVPQRPNARRVPQQVEGVFQNRVVYCTAMPGPSGASDWVVWFGETEALPPGSRIVMRPPVAGKTALPVGKTAGPAETRFWIVARLGKNGRLTAVNITGGLAAKQAQELANEMDKWVFTPAIRNGEAVDVDLVLEAKLSGTGM